MKEIELDLPESFVKRLEEIAEILGMTAEELLSEVVTIMLRRDLEDPERWREFEKSLEEAKEEAKKRGISVDEYLAEVSIQGLEEWAKDEKYWEELKKQLSE